jgi:hypothetical protein
MPSNNVSIQRDGWIDFDSTTFNKNIRQRVKNRSNRDPPDGQRAVNQEDISSTMTPSWMKQPVNSDASWIPIPPPDLGSSAIKKVITNEVMREGRTRNRSTPRSKGKLVSSHSLPVEKSNKDATQDRRLQKDISKCLEDRNDSSRSLSDCRGRASSRELTKAASVSHHTRTSTSVPPDQRKPARSSSLTPETSRRRSGSRTPVARENTSNMLQMTRSPCLVASPRTKGCIGSSSSTGPGLPRSNRTPRSTRNIDDGSIRTSESAQTLDSNLGKDLNFGHVPPIQRAESPSTPSRKEGGIMDKLFGVQGEKQAQISHRESSLTSSGDTSFQLPGRIHTRTLLSATVYHNAATNLWITTINTNQRGVAINPATASKYLKAFSFSSEKEARESAIANAPPKMLPFDDNPHCFICNAKFALFRRPSHCRNCGVCICSECTTTWSSKMIPLTYNLKNENNVNICSTCNILSEYFQKALINGNNEEMIALYGTGNVNLRCSLPVHKKGEIMHPIHYAVEGGNLTMVRWLIEQRFCPIKKVASGNGKQKRGIDIPLLTSKGRSVLQIAMENLHIDIVRYLVVERNVSVYEMKDLSLTLRILESALNAMPQNISSIQNRSLNAKWADDEFCEDDASDISGSLHGINPRLDDSIHGSRRTGDMTDSCIICYDNAIDCVITPCGHQICCLGCAENMKSCPVCNVNCEFIRIFKP